MCPHPVGGTYPQDVENMCTPQRVFHRLLSSTLHPQPCGQPVDIRPVSRPSARFPCLPAAASCCGRAKAARPQTGCFPSSHYLSDRTDRTSVRLFVDDRSPERLPQQIGVRPRVLFEHDVVVPDRHRLFLRRQRRFLNLRRRRSLPSLLSRHRSLSRPPLAGSLLPPINLRRRRWSGRPTRLLIRLQRSPHLTSNLLYGDRPTRLPRTPGRGTGPDATRSPRPCTGAIAPASPSPNARANPSGTAGLITPASATFSPSARATADTSPSARATADPGPIGTSPRGAGLRSHPGASGTRTTYSTARATRTSTGDLRTASTRGPMVRSPTRPRPTWLAVLH